MELNIPRIEHEKDGRIKPGGFNNEFVTAQMEACGYHHLGYTYGYSGNRMSRFTYCLNLDQPLETIRKQIKHYAAYQKKNIQRAVQAEFHALQWPFAWTNMQDGRGAASYVQGFLDALSAEKNVLCLGGIPHLQSSKSIQLASLQDMLDQPLLKKRLWQFMQNKTKD